MLPKNKHPRELFNKIILCIFVICTSLTVNSISADELLMASETGKKYNLSVCAIFKNEARNLKGWIDYHHDLGVEHFYLYNCGSRDDFRLVLIPYMNEGLVTLVNWPNLARQEDEDAHAWELGSQVPAFENAVNFLAKDETKWLLLVDVDEYLVCPKGNMADLLIEYDDFPSIALSSYILDGTLKDPIPLKKIFSHTSGRSNAETQAADESVAKMIFKPELCSGFTWPPYQCKFNTPQSGIKADPQELRINHYLNRNRRTPSHKNKALGKQDDAGDILLSISSRIDGPKNEYLDINGNEDLYQPMYIYMPEFLKKLKSQEQQKSTF